MIAGLSPYDVTFSRVLRWIAVAACVVQGAYMAFDGARALVVGSYVTPGGGDHAGQLGPWPRLVEAVGIPPESTGMKAAFVVFGVLWLLAAGGIADRRRLGVAGGHRARGRDPLVPRPRHRDQHPGAGAAAHPPVREALGRG